MKVKQYAANSANWKNEGINSEDEAIALLLGLKPEPWLRYFRFNEKYSKRDWVSLSQAEQTEKSFMEEYGDFFEKTFDFIPEGSRHAVLPQWFNVIKERNAWNGDFLAYAQALHDDGVLFRPDVVKSLNLKYSPDARAWQFYSDWEKKAAWIFHDAVCLFAGANPDTAKREEQGKPTTYKFNGKEYYPFFCTDLRQYNHQIKYSELEKLLDGHIAAGKLKRLPNSDYFDPVTIVKWLKENTSYNPPPPLLDILFPVGKRKSQPLSEATLKKAYKEYIANKKSSVPFPTWKDDQKAMEQALGKKPTDNQIKKIRREMAPNVWKQQGRRKKAA